MTFRLLEVLDFSPHLNERLGLCLFFMKWEEQLHVLTFQQSSRNCLYWHSLCLVLQQTQFMRCVCLVWQNNKRQQQNNGNDKQMYHMDHNVFALRQMHVSQWHTITPQMHHSLRDPVRTATQQSDKMPRTATQQSHMSHRPVSSVADAQEPATNKCITNASQSMWWVYSLLTKWRTTTKQPNVSHRLWCICMVPGAWEPVTNECTMDVSCSMWRVCPTRDHNKIPGTAMYGKWLLQSCALHVLVAPWTLSPTGGCMFDREAPMSASLLQSV